VHQQPNYPAAGVVKEAVAEIERMPPLVFAGECRTLQERLAKCATGEAFMLQGESGEEGRGMAAAGGRGGAGAGRAGAGGCADAIAWVRPRLERPRRPRAAPHARRPAAARRPRPRLPPPPPPRPAAAHSVTTGAAVGGRRPPPRAPARRLARAHAHPRPLCPPRRRLRRVVRRLLRQPHPGHVPRHPPDGGRAHVWRRRPRRQGRAHGGPVCQAAVGRHGDASGRERVALLPRGHHQRPRSDDRRARARPVAPRQGVQPVGGHAQPPARVRDRRVRRPAAGHAVEPGLHGQVG